MDVPRLAEGGPPPLSCTRNSENNSMEMTYIFYCGFYGFQNICKNNRKGVELFCFYIIEKLQFRFFLMNWRASWELQQMLCRKRKWHDLLCQRSLCPVECLLRADLKLYLIIIFVDIYNIATVKEVNMYYSK